MHNIVDLIALALKVDVAYVWLTFVQTTSEVSTTGGSAAVRLDLPDLTLVALSNFPVPTAISPT